MDKNKKGVKLTLYVSKDLMVFIKELQKVSKKLNISLIRALIDIRYRENDFVKEQLIKMQNNIKRDEVFNKISKRLRDSAIFDKSNSSSLKLEERGLHKSDIIEHFINELELLDLSDDLTLKSKSILRKKLKFQLRNFRKVKVSSLTKRRELRRIESINQHY